AVLFQFGVDRFQFSALWEGHEIVTARITDQIFDAPFFPPGMHISKERLKAVDTMEVQKHVVLSPAMSLQHLQDSWLEVVIDRHARYTSPELESVSLTEQKGLLSLGGETFHKHRPRKAEPSGQERDFHQLA